MAEVLALFAIVLALLGLAGHLLSVPALYSMHAGFQAMSLLTAVGLMMVAAAALGRVAVRRKPTLVASIFGTAIAGAALASHIIVGHDALNPAIAAAFGMDKASAGKTSVSTAISVLALSLATSPWFDSRRRLTDALAGATFLISLLALAGYAYSSADLYALPFFRTMALNTAITIMLLSCATIFGRSDGGWGATIGASGEAGRSTRRQLLFLLIPPVVGWLLVQASNAGHLRLGSAMALLVVLSVAPLLWLILRDGRALVALDHERALRITLEKDYRHSLEERLADQAVALDEKSQARFLVAEAAQLKSEGRYRSLFESIDAGFCVVEMRFAADGTPEDYRFLETNSQFEASTGLQHAEGSWMRILAPNHEQHWFDIYGQVAKTGIATRFDNPAKALGDRWYEVHAFRVDDPLVGHVGVLFNDISERKRAEDDLLQINATLEQRIVDAIAQREYAQAALRQSQKMEAMGQLTGGVAHDFNNLLTPILGSLDLLSRSTSITDRERRLLDGALQSAERARLLVQRLLAFARRQPLQPGPVAIPSLVAGMADLVASTSGPKVRVIVDMPSDLPLALADAHQLEMAILNLCVNARDAMADGGTLTLAASAEAPPASGHLSLSERSYIRLTVADTGLGMDPETLKRAVEPFYSTKGIGKGTGLGLSMVHGLMAQLNGTLDIKSSQGFGTRIDLWLPISDAKMDEKPIVPLPAIDATHRGRALVVDDEAVVRSTTADMLQDLGYETVEVASAREAHSLLLDGEVFDVVVTDHLMPGMTGAELALAVRRHRPGLPLLLVSGYADVEAIAPDIPCLAKPFRREELSIALAEIAAAARG